jgi:hypothetical protein
MSSQSSKDKLDRLYHLHDSYAVNENDHREVVDEYRDTGN